MNFEEDVFKKKKIDYNLLIKYGFKKENDLYYYHKKFMNDFEAQIVIDNNGKVKGKVIDIRFNEEYINLRIINQTGEFVGKVREEYLNILEDIVRHCCKDVYFKSEQANRITKYIINKYQNEPEFLWDKTPDCAIFRNADNQKWYGIIMSVDKSKITDGVGEVEIIDLKNDSDLKQKGIYKGYHMNKKSWITIILDNSLSDSEIFKLIDISYDLVKGK